jgi:hypothetical protein
VAQCLEMLKAIQSQYVRRAGLIASSATHLLFFAQCKLHTMLAPVRDQLNADLTALRANKTPLKSFFSSTKGYVRFLYAVHETLIDPTTQPPALKWRVSETTTASHTVRGAGFRTAVVSVEARRRFQPASVYELASGC